MMNVFGIRISEGGIQNILSQLSDSLGDKYSSLLQAIRDAPSRHMDQHTGGWTKSIQSMDIPDKERGDICRA